MNQAPSTKHQAPARLPRISIVTPSFNQGRYLEQTIRSVLEQGYPNLEYIIIDGGSTDGSVEIIKKYASALAYWVSEPDRGQAHALNKGLARATGEVLAYLNADDVYEPGALAAVAAAMAEQPAADLVYGAYAYADTAGRVTERHTPPAFHIGALALGNTLSQPAVFMRRRVWERVGPFEETLHCVLDYDYWLRAAVRGCRFERLDRPLARMRMHPASKTATREPEFWTETVRMLERLFAGADLPQPLLAVRPRALARARWLAAITLANAGLDQEAERYARSAVAEFELSSNLEDLDFVLQRLLYGRHGRLLAPERLERRLRTLGFDRQEFEVLAEIVDEEYLSRLRHRTNSMTRVHALSVLGRAVLAKPQRLRTWAVRRALWDALWGQR